MLNILWPIFIIISFSYSIFTGRINEINNAIFSSTYDAVQFCINLIRDNMPLEWLNANCI